MQGHRPRAAGHSARVRRRLHVEPAQAARAGAAARLRALGLLRGGVQGRPGGGHTEVGGGGGGGVGGGRPAEDFHLARRAMAI